MVTAIVSSGYAMDPRLCRYEDLGFRGVIVKPYESAELGRTVRDVMSVSRLGCEFQYVQRSMLDSAAVPPLTALPRNGR